MLIFIFEIQGAANRCGYDSFIRWQAYKNGRGHTSFTPIALTRLAAKTHGVRVARARELYTKVIRSVLSYGATAWHTPTQVGGTPRGVVRGLQATQTRCLRVVAGAYKATPNRNVESETWVPPLDLYLNRWVARTEQRLEETGMARLISSAHAATATQPTCTCWTRLRTRCTYTRD